MPQIACFCTVCVISGVDWIVLKLCSEYSCEFFVVAANS